MPSIAGLKNPGLLALLAHPLIPLALGWTPACREKMAESRNGTFHAVRVRAPRNRARPQGGSATAAAPRLRIVLPPGGCDAVPACRPNALQSDATNSGPPREGSPPPSFTPWRPQSAGGVREPVREPPPRPEAACPRSRTVLCRNVDPRVHIDPQNQQTSAACSGAFYRTRRVR